MKTILGQVTDTDIRLLRVFKAIAESGGLSAAELELNIGRSTISRHLKDLEIRLKVSLCQRGRSGFRLTAEGQKIYQATNRLLASLDEFRTEVVDLHKHMSGTLTLALFDKTASNPEAKISQAIQLFTRAAPAVEIEIYVEPINTIEQGVIDGRFQLGVIPTHRPSTSLEYMPLFNEQMYLYCGHSHPLFSGATRVSTAEINRYHYAGLGYHSPNMEVGHQLKLNRAATAYDQEGIATLILSGAYLGFLPDHYARPFVAQGLMTAIGQQQSAFQYTCEFVGITRLSPKPARILSRFMECLNQAHQS